MDLSTLLDETFGRSKEALPLLQEALTITRDTGNRNLEARALNNLGAVYLAQGQYSDAQTYFERALEIREKTKAPQEAADTLHNLGDAFTRMGRYDQALQRYIRALELRRTAGDKRNAALASYGIGTIFDYQGRYGSAVKSKGEALQAFRDLKQRDVWLGEILSGYGNSLNLSGRTGDAQAPLDEALEAGERIEEREPRRADAEVSGRSPLLWRRCETRVRAGQAGRAGGTERLGSEPDAPGAGGRGHYRERAYSRRGGWPRDWPSSRRRPTRAVSSRSPWSARFNVQRR